MFSHEITALAVQVSDIEEGAETVEIGVIEGQGVPVFILDERGEQHQQLATVPCGVYRFSLDREALEKHITSLQEQFDKMPEPKKPSDLIIAGDMRQAEKVASIDKMVRG